MSPVPSPEPVSAAQNHAAAPSSEPVVVTGGGGHVGTNLVAALRAAGHPVRVLDRREPVTALRLGAEWVPGDVRDEALVQRACAGAGVLYHVAAVISVVGGMGGLVESVNVDGTRAAARAARAAGVRRMVYCSSVHAFDLAACVGEVVDESSPRSVRPTLPVYDRSKASAEVEVRRLVEQGLDAVMVNPTGIIGPRDETPSRMGAVLRAFWRGRLTTMVDGGFDWVDVRDVVAALVAAADHGDTGANYLVGGERCEMGRLAELAAATAGTAYRRRIAPAWSVRAVAPLATVIARRTGSSLMPTGEALAALNAFPVVNCARATRDLGHRPRPLAETLADLYASFLDNGTLSSRSPLARRS